jgi:hypothetical protein
MLKAEKNSHYEIVRPKVEGFYQLTVAKTRKLSGEKNIE